MRKKVNHKEVLEFTYDSEEERNTHVEEMKENGWIDSEQKKRLKPEVSIYDAHKDFSREWYACFYKHY